MSFSLRLLFIAILFIAVAIVALLNANPQWVAAFRCVIVIVLPLTIIAAICSTGAKRAFWIGFAVAGWLHLFSIALNYLPPFRDFHPELAEQDALWLHARTGEEEGVFTVRPHYAAFLIVYHCFKTMAFAFLGGYVAVWFYSRRDATK